MESGTAYLQALRCFQITRSGDQVKIARYALLLCAVFAGHVYAADPWGTTWGESFDSVKAKYPEAKVLDLSKADYCKGSKIETCQQRQVEVSRTIAGNLPARVIFIFSPEAKLASVLVSLEEPEKYTPSRLGIAYKQMQLLLEKEYGKPIGGADFALKPDPSPYNKNGLSGQAASVWHSDDSVISLDVKVIGTDSETKPARVSILFISYKPLQLIGK